MWPNKSLIHKWIPRADLKKIRFLIPENEFEEWIRNKMEAVWTIKTHDVLAIHDRY